MERVFDFPRKIFIAIDGIDGVGKTTIAKSLASKIGAVYYRTPPQSVTLFSLNQGGDLVSIRDFVDEYAPPYERFLFYLWSVARASDEISQVLLKSSVVCDRYWASTLAYHRAMLPALEAVNISKISILEPDFYFLLNVNDLEECNDRINERECRSSFDQHLEDDKELQHRVQQEFLRLGLEVIDASHSLEIVETDIISRLRCLLFENSMMAEVHEG